MPHSRCRTGVSGEAGCPSCGGQAANSHRANSGKSFSNKSKGRSLFDLSPRGGPLPLRGQAEKRPGAKIYAPKFVHGTHFVCPARGRRVEDKTSDYQKRLIEAAVREVYAPKSVHVTPQGVRYIEDKTPNYPRRPPKGTGRRGR